MARGVQVIALTASRQRRWHQLLNPATAMAHTVFFTDLDRCLLDGTADSLENARPALNALRADGIPLILTSGKTRAEIEPLRQRIDHRDPFIVENGAAVFIPLGTFDFPLERSRDRASYQVIELGTPYAMLRDVLRQIEEAVKSPLRGFGDLSLDDIMRETGLSHDEALRAKLREYGEPFLMKGPRTLIAEVFRQIAARELRCTKGERFFHLTGANSTARASDMLLRSYRRKWRAVGKPHLMEAVVIEDRSQNGAMLLNANHPVIDTPGSSDVIESDGPRLIHAQGLGATGWNDTVLDLLKRVA
jgi:mannosyl-3-phosphoglycerate phosphatase